MGTYTVYTYFSTQGLYWVFNAVASIFHLPDFQGWLKMLMLLGLVGALAVTFITRGFGVFTWFIQSLIVLTVLNIPVATVTIVDVSGQQGAMTVGNVPVMLAAVADAASHSGKWLASIAETSLSVLPVPIASDMQFSQHDVAFGHRVVEKARQATITDPELYADVVNFFSDCVNKSIQDGTLNYTTITQANGTNGDIWQELGTSVNPARMTTIRSMSNAQVVPCNLAMAGGSVGSVSVAASDAIEPRVLQGVTQAQAYYGAQLNPNVSQSIAQTMMASELPDALNMLGNISTNASDAIKHNMFLNMWQNSQAQMSARAGDAAGAQQALALAQAEATTNSSYLTTANIAEETIPKFRNVFESMIYFLFPVFVGMAVLAGDKCFPLIRNYAMGIVWINLWPFCYVVVNSIGILHSASKLSTQLAAAGGLTIASAGDFDNGLLTDHAIYGYLVVSVPFLAALITKGMDMVMTPIVSHMLSPMQSAAGSAAGSASGNVSLGNESVDNHAYHSTTGNKVDTATAMRTVGITYTDRNLNTVTSTGSAVQIEQARSTLNASASVNANQAVQLSNQAAQADQESLNYSKMAANSRQAALDISKGHGVSGVGSTAVGTNASMGTSATSGNGTASTDKTGDGAATSDQSANTQSLNASAGGGVSGGLGGGSGVPGVSASATVRQGNEYANTQSSIQTKTTGHDDSHQRTHNVDHTAGTTENSSHQRSLSATDEQRRTALLKEADSFEKKASASRQHAIELREQAQASTQLAHVQGYTISAQAMVTVLERAGGLSNFLKLEQSNPVAAVKLLNDAISAVDAGGLAPTPPVPSTLPSGAPTPTAATLNDAYKNAPVHDSTGAAFKADVAKTGFAPPTAPTDTVQPAAQAKVKAEQQQIHTTATNIAASSGAQNSAAAAAVSQPPAARAVDQTVTPVVNAVDSVVTGAANNAKNQLNRVGDAIENALPRELQDTTPRDGRQ